MHRLLPLFVTLLLVPPVLAQHAIEAIPNPYDEAVADTLILWNSGAEPVSLDSLRFQSSFQWVWFGWHFKFEAHHGSEEVRGNVVCDPVPHVPCDNFFGLFGSTFAPGDSLVIYSLEAYCAICKGGSGRDTVDDTLLVYAGGLAEPLEVEILNGSVMVSAEGGGPTVDDRIEAFPNPTRGNVTLRLNLEKSSEVVIRVYDVRGRIVAEFEQRVFGVGEHTVPLSLGRLPSGVYIVAARFGAGAGMRSGQSIVVVN